LARPAHRLDGGPGPLLSPAAPGAQVRQDASSVANRQGGKTKQRQRDRLEPPSALAVDSAANELYVADGSAITASRVRRDDRRVQAQLGAYGDKPTDTDLGAYDPNAAASKQFPR